MELKNLPRSELLQKDFKVIPFFSNYLINKEGIIINTKIKKEVSNNISYIDELPYLSLTNDQNERFKLQVLQLLLLVFDYKDDITNASIIFDFKDGNKTNFNLDNIFINKEKKRTYEDNDEYTKYNELMKSLKIVLTFGRRSKKGILSIKKLFGNSINYYLLTDLDSKESNSFNSFNKLCEHLCVDYNQFLLELEKSNENFFIKQGKNYKLNIL